MFEKNKGTIFILISALLFGSYGVWSKLIGDSFGVFYQGWSRALIIIILLTPLLWWKKCFVKIAKSDWKWLSIFLFFIAFTQAPLFYAFNNMDIGTATMLFFVSMLITMNLFGIFFLGEKLTKIKIVSLILAIAGMGIVFPFSFSMIVFFAASMAVLNGFASGGEVAMSKKLTGNYSTLYITWLTWIAVFITNAPISIFLGEVQHLPSFDIVWLYQVGYTIASLGAFWLVIEGLKTVEAGIGGILGLLEIVFSIVFGYIIFGEHLTFMVMCGALLILLAACLPYLCELKEKNKKIDS